MRTSIKAMADAAATGATLVQKSLVRKIADRTGHRGPGSAPVDTRRWRVVTVARPLEEIGDDLPAPLDRLRDVIEVRLTPAPGDKGTELAARFSGDPPVDLNGEPPVEALRRALREAKQLLEAGWIPQPAANVSTKPTPWNAPLRAVIRHARGEGRL